MMKYDGVMWCNVNISIHNYANICCIELYVYIYVYICICIYICYYYTIVILLQHIYIYTYTYMYIYNILYVTICIYIYVYVYTHMHNVDQWYFMNRCHFDPQSSLEVSDFTDCPCALLDGTPQLGEIWVPWQLVVDAWFMGSVAVWLYMI